MRTGALLGALALFAAGLVVGLWCGGRREPEAKPLAPLAATQVGREGVLVPELVPAVSRERASPSVIELVARVADRATNAPIDGAELVLVALAHREAAERRAVELGRARADAAGRVRLSVPFERESSSSYELVLSAPKHVQRTQPLALEPDVASTVELGWLFLDEVPGPGARVTGVVRDRNGMLVSGALVFLGSDPLYPLADARAVGLTLEDGSIELDSRVAPSDRTATQHLFVLAPEGLAWTSVRIGERADAVELGTLELARSTHATVRVVDADGRPVGGVRVEARARFYPCAGLFDAREPGFTPDERLLALFLARTDSLGEATFDALPVPFVSGQYEFTCDEPGIGAGSSLTAEFGPEQVTVVALDR